MGNKIELDKIKEELCSDSITSEDGIMKFQFHKNDTVDITKKGKKTKVVKYTITAVKFDEGSWILEYDFDGYTDSIPFFFINELIEELTEREWGADSY